MSSSNFVDYVKICCRSGKGGAGSTHFHRDRTTAKGGPDGGDGGRGGNIILKGNNQIWTLLSLKYRKHIIAKHGESGGSALKHGKDGKDELIEVPLGTVAKDAETGETLFEITEHGEEVVLVEGGRGGLGNDHFKSSTNQSPRYAQPGEDGRDEWKILELKVLADVGLVGFPNAGKSTLVNALTKRKTSIIGSTPNTTRDKVSTIIEFDNEKKLMISDLPGFLEKTDEFNVNFQENILRYIDNAEHIIFLIDVLSTQY